MRDPSTHPTVSYRDQYTLGGIVVYAAVVPAIVVTLAAPVVTAAFVAGALTAALIGRIRSRTRTSPEATTDDADAAGVARH